MIFAKFELTIQHTAAVDSSVNQRSKYLQILPELVYRLNRDTGRLPLHWFFHSDKVAAGTKIQKVER